MMGMNNYGVGILLHAKDMFSKNAQKMERSMKGLGTTTDLQSRRIEKGMARIKRGAIMMGIGAGMLAAVAVPAKMAVSWEAGMAKVSTLVDENKVNMGILSDDLLRISAGMGQTQAASINAAYNIKSAWGTGWGPVQEGLPKVFALAGKAAIAGMTDINTAGKLGTQVLNAYQLGVGDLEDVYDMLFTTVNMGVTTFPELAASLGQVLATGKSAKVPLDQLVASVAALTKVGVNTPEAVTSLNMLFMALKAPTSAAAKEIQKFGGQAFKVASQTGDFVGMLKALAPKLKDLDQMKGVTPNIRALKGLAALTGNMKELNTIMEAQARRTGAFGEAYAKMAATVEHQSKVAGEQFNRLWTILGSGLLPILNKIVGAISWVAEHVANWAQNNKGLAGTLTVIVGALGAVVTILGAVNLISGLYNLVLAGSIVKLKLAAFAVKHYTVCMWSAVAANWALIWPVLAVVAAVGLLAGAVYLVIKNWDSISAYFSKLWRGVKMIFMGVVDWVGTWWGDFKSVWNDYGGDWLLAAMVPFIGIPLLIIKHWESITGFFGKLWGTVKDIWKTSGAVIMAVMIPFVGIPLAIVKHWESITGFFKNIWKSITGGIRSFVDTIKGIFIKIGDFFMAPFLKIWAMIQKVIALIPNWALPAQLESIKASLLTAGTIGITALAVPVAPASTITPVAASSYQVPQMMSTTSRILEREIIREKSLDKSGKSDEQHTEMMKELKEIKRRSISVNSRLQLDGREITTTVTKKQWQNVRELPYR